MERRAGTTSADAIYDGDGMIQVSEELRGAVDQTAGILPQAIAAAVTVLALFVVGRLAGTAIVRLVGTRGSARFATVARRVVQWAFTILGLVIALHVLGLTAIAGSLLATGGLMAVILGFAFRSIGENLLAGIFLGFSRTFEVGDLIESSGHTGIVRDISLRAVHVRSGDGRDIFIPCAQIFTNPLINFTRDGLRRGDFVIGVDYRHDPGAVREILLRTVQKSRGVLTDPAPAVLVSEFHAGYQEFRVLFWVDTRGEGNLGHIRSYLMRACVNALKEADIVLSSDVTTAVALEPVKVEMPPGS